MKKISVLLLGVGSALCLAGDLPAKSTSHDSGKERAVDGRSAQEEDLVPNPLKVKLTEEEREMFRLVNAWRVQNRLGKVAPAPSLNKGACEHSKRMADYNQFLHADNGYWQSVLGFQPVLPGNQNGYRAENIYAGKQTVADVFTGWKNSPGHNANMLNANMKYMGICHATNPGSTYKIYWTQTFSSGPEAAASDAPIASTAK